jgi:hypothetical protein
LSDVVVGEGQTVGGDEGAGAAAVEADGRLLDVLEPGGGDGEAVGLLNLVFGGLVEEPHTFVGEGGASANECETQYDWEAFHEVS